MENTNVNPNNNISIINAGKLKKSPHNITIKNFNPNEPKTHKPKNLYSEKQNYRRYKTKTEPKLYSKIMIDEEDDLIAKIRKEFGITAENKKTNYSEVNTSGANYVKDPEPITGKQTQPPKYKYEISDISRDENEDIRGELIDIFKSKLDLGKPLDLNIDYDAVLESAVEEDDDEPAALTREDSTATVLSEASTIMLSEIETLENEAKSLGISLKRGPKPKKPEAIEARHRDLKELIAEKKAEKASKKAKK